MADSDDESLVALPDCPICFEPYDDEEEDHKPRNGSCPHSVCHGCVTKNPNNKCPFCRARSFAKSKYNLALIEQIAKQKKKALAINQLVEDNKNKDKRIVQLEADAKEAMKFEGYKCSSCSYPMMEDAAFVCMDCLPKKLKFALEADDFDDMYNLLTKLLCGGCILKNHNGHSNQPLHAIQIQKKVVRLKDRLSKSFAKTGRRMDVMCGKTAMIKEIEDMHATLHRTIEGGVFQMLASSPSLKEFKQKESQLNRVAQSINEATDDVIKNLYQLKQCLEDAVNTTQRMAPMFQPGPSRACKVDELSSKDVWERLSQNAAGSSKSNLSFSAPRPSSPLVSRLDSPLLSESTLLEDGVPSPSWPPISCTSPPAIHSGGHEPRAKRSRLSDDVPCRTFKFLHLADETASPFAEQIKDLGGTVIPRGDFNPKEVTHVICSKMTPTVSLYCLMAKGCWFLKEDYVSDCSEVGQWLQEELYEWGNPNITHTASLATDELLVVSAAQRWRRTLANSGWNTEGAFAGWRVLIYATFDKYKILEPMLASGGAHVVNRKFYKGSVAEFEPSHVLVDGGNDWNERELAEVATAGGKVFIPEFIWNRLLDENITEDHYFHEDYKNLLKSG